MIRVKRNTVARRPNNKAGRKISFMVGAVVGETKV